MRGRKRKESRYFLGFLVSSLTGVAVFVLLPFGDVVRRSFLTVMSGEYVGLNNYRAVLHNQAFRLAVKNTICFSVTAIVLVTGLGLAAALLLSRLQRIRLIKSLYLFPLAIPAAAVVIVWHMFFYSRDFGSLTAAYLWKYSGYTIVLWLAGIAAISRQLTEAARVDGADRLQVFLFVELPCLRGSLYTIIILSFLNSLKIYREVYLAAGAYPGEDIYMLQHLFHNWYVSLEFDKMAAATVLTAGALLGALLFFPALWRK